MESRNGGLKEKKIFTLSRKDKFNQTFIERIEESIVESIYGVVYILLKDDEGIPHFLEYLLMLLEFFQFWAFPFNSSVSEVWKDKDKTDLLYHILNAPNFTDYLHTATSNAFIATFYFCFALVGMVAMNIVYISISFNRKYFTVTWPLYILRYLAKFILTIFFMPLFEIFISISSCYTKVINEKTVYINTFPKDELICYEGIYFLHLIASVFIIFVLVFISFSAASIYYEVSDHSHEGKTTNKADFFITISKMVTIFSFTIGYNYKYILILLLVVLSTYKFYLFFNLRPYHDTTKLAIMLILTGLYSWTNICLLFQAIFQIEDSLYYWICGMPFICLYFILEGSHTTKELSKNVFKARTGKEVMNYMRALIHLVLEPCKTRNLEVNLRGFIRTHQNNVGECPFSDCPITMIQVNLENKEQEFLKKNQQVKQQILNYINKIYILTTDKFLDDSGLMIGYALFLYNHLKQKTKAKIWFNKAEKISTKFDERFIIFRYLKFIAEDLDASNNYDEDEGDQLDIVSEIAYESHFRQLFDNISNSSQNFHLFWEILLNSDQSPSTFDKLNDIGLKINESIENVKIHWQKMQSYKPNLPRALTLYGEFLKILLNQESKGQELIDLSNETENKHKSKIKKSNSEKEENLTSQNYSSNIFISFTAEEDFGQVVKFTTNACNLFKYTPTELGSKNIDDLFIDIYSNCVSENVKGIINSMTDSSNQTFTYFIKTKSGYTEPIKFSIVDPKENISDKIHFKVLIKPFDSSNSNLVNKKRTAFFILNSKFTILNSSESSVDLLKTMKTRLTNEKPNLIKFFPEFIQKDEEDEENLNRYVFENKGYNNLQANSNNENDITNTIFYKHIDEPDFEHPVELKRQNSHIKITVKFSLVPHMKMKVPKSVVVWKNSRTNNSVEKKKLKPTTMKKFSGTPSLFSKEESAHYATDKEKINYLKIKKFRTQIESSPMVSMNNKLSIASPVMKSFARKASISKKEAQSFLNTLSKQRQETPKKSNKNTNRTLRIEVSDNDKIDTRLSFDNDNSIEKEIFYWVKIDFHYLTYDRNSQNTNTSQINLLNPKYESTYLKVHLKNTLKTIKLLAEGNNTVNSQSPLNNNLIPYFKNLKSSPPLWQFIQYEKLKQLNMSENDLNDINLPKRSGRNGSNWFDSISKHITDNQDISDEEELLDEESCYSTQDIMVIEKILSNNRAQFYATSASLREDIERLRNFGDNVDFFMGKVKEEWEQKFYEPNILRKINEDEALFLHHTDEEVIDPDDKLESIRKKLLNKEKKDKKIPNSIPNLRIATLISLVVLLSFAVIEFIFSNKLIDNIRQNIINFMYASEALNEITLSTLLVRDIFLAKNLSYSNFGLNGDRISYLNKTKLELSESIVNINYILENLTSSNLELLPNHRKLLYDDTTTYYTLNTTGQITQQKYGSLYFLLSYFKGYLLRISLEDNFALNLTMLNTYIYNSMNDFYSASNQNIDFYYDLIAENLDYTHKAYYIIVPLTFGVIIMMSLILFDLLNKVDSDRKSILGSFYEIPEFYLKYLKELCLKYTEKLQFPEAIQEESIEFFAKLSDHLPQMIRFESGKGNKEKLRRKVKFGDLNRFQIIPLAGGLLFIFVFIFVNFILTNFLSDNLMKFRELYRHTLLLESKLTFEYSLIKERIIKDDYAVTNNITKSFPNTTIKDIFIKKNVMNHQFVEYQYDFPSTKTFFSDIMYGDLCLQSFFVNSTICQDDKYKLSTKKGLSMVLSHFLDIIERLNKNFLLYPNRTNYSDILNQKNFIDAEELTLYVIKPCFHEITWFMKAELEEKIKADSSVRLIIFIINIIYIMLGYLMYVMPYQAMLKDEIRRTQMMIEIIPDEIQIEYMNDYYNRE